MFYMVALGAIYRRESRVDKAMSKEKNELDIKQLKFIDNLFKGKSRGQAYMEAGYDVKNTDVGSAVASRLLKNVKVKEELEWQITEVNRINRVRLASMSEAALARLFNLVKGAGLEDRVNLDAVKDALDRAGLKPVEKYQYSGEMTYKLIDVDMSKYPKNE